MKALATLVLGLGMGITIGRYTRGECSFWVLMGLAAFCAVMVAVTLGEKHD